MAQSQEPLAGLRAQPASLLLPSSCSLHPDGKLEGIDAVSLKLRDAAASSSARTSELPGPGHVATPAGCACLGSTGGERRSEDPGRSERNKE